MAKVLVIEDNPLNTKLASLLLRNAGHTVLCAVDAETGLTLARAERPDLVLMDFQLPGMDGLAATVLLKQDPVTAAIPVIALTAMTMKADQERSQLAGCDAFIAKPLRYQDLYAAIDTLLAKNAPHAASEAKPLYQANMPASRETALPSAASRLRLHGETSPQTAALAAHVGVLESLIGNDPVVILEFLDIFRISAAKIALELKTACADRQTVQAGKQAHKLKSSAHTVGALALSELCAKMEAAGKAGSAETLAALLPMFEQELDAVNAFLDSFEVRQRADPA